MSSSNLFSRNVAGVVVISFLISVGFGAVNLLIPYLVMALQGILMDIPEKLGRVEAGQVVLELGALSASFMTTRALVAFLSGWLSDILGRKKLIVTGMAIYVAVGVAYAYVDSVVALILLRAVQGIASALVWPVAETLLVESVEPHIRTRAMSLYIMAMNIGHVAGPAVGAAAYEAAKTLLAGSGPIEVFRAPFIIVAAATLPGLVVSIAIRETLTTRKSQDQGGIRTRILGELAALDPDRARALQAFYANSLLNGVAIGIMMSVMMAYVIEFIVKEPQLLGTAMAVSGLVGLVAAYPLARLADTLSPQRRKRMLIVSALTGRTALMLIAFIRDLPSFIAVSTIANLAFNAFMPLLRSTQASLAPPTARGRVFGIQQAMFNTGMILGPLLGSAIYKAVYKTVFLGLTGAQWIFIAAALLGYTGVILIHHYYRPEKPIARR